jgi:hypothetical protein
VRYRKDILLPHVVPFLQAHIHMTLQHDNATSHAVCSVRYYIYTLKIYGGLEMHSE